MKKMNFNPIFILFISIVILSGCSSSTLIHSEPPGATIYIDGEEVGETPYRYSDEDIFFTKHDVKLEKEGYQDFYSSFRRDEEINIPIAIGGFFVWPIWLWVFDYDYSRTYVLKPLENGDVYKKENTSSKAKRLREMKELFDEGAITREEYEKEKEKILNEKE